MSEEVTKSLEELKKLSHDLAEAVKGQKVGQEEITKRIKDIEDAQNKFQTKRKGSFAGDDEDEDKLGSQFKATGSIDLLINSKSLDERVIELQKANDDILLVSQVLGIAPHESKMLHEFKKVNPFLSKALDTAESGGGADWVPTMYSPRLFDRVRLALRVAALHETLTMPSAVYKPPVVSSDATGYLVSERTGDDDTLTADNRIKASQPGTGNFTLTAKKLAGRVIFSEELNEDSIIPVLPMVQNNIVRAIASAIENAMINGDTDGTHQDSDVTTATDARRAWNGYRREVQSTAKESLATFNGDNILKLRKAMGRYGVMPTDLALVVGISGYNQLLNLKDSANNPLVATLDKYGAGATILAGELGKLYGMPIIVSEYCREDLNASGVYDSTTTTKAVMLCVYRPGWLSGERRSLKVKTAEDINTDQTVLVATVRRAFSRVYTGTEKVVALGYNITA